MIARAVALTFLLAHAAQATTNVPCTPANSRELMHQAQLIAIAHPVSTMQWEIEHVILGPSVHDIRADIALTRAVCEGIEIGRSYLICQRCSDDPFGDCEVSARPVEQAGDDLAFLRERHFENWETLLGALQSWSASGSSATFHRWAKSADTEEWDRQSRTLVSIRYLEFVSGDIVRLEMRAPEHARRVRDSALAELIRELPCAAPQDLDGIFRPWNDPLEVAFSKFIDSSEWRNAMHALNIAEGYQR